MRYWNSNVQNRLIIILYILLISVKSAIAQTVPAPKFESPNTASLGKYGDNPVSYFTGVPSISFPIYNINVGNINVPVSLNYHSGSVKPNEHPGWNGLGWNLNIYGKITRTVKNWFDEGDNQSPTVYCYFPDLTYHPEGNGATYINTSDWNTATRMSNIYAPKQPDPPFYDASADEFNFNFGNYSGTFYYSASGWQVISENTNIKVQELGFMNDQEINSNLVNFNPSYVGTSSKQSRMFRGFIVTTDDGTKYTFGCETSSGVDLNCGVEFKATYAEPSSGVIANSWLLRKIEDINGQVVKYEYQKKAPTCAMSFYTAQTNYSCYYDWSSASGWQDGPVNTNLHAGVLLYPVYLKKIITSKEVIDFNISETSELRYDDRYLRYAADDAYGPGGLVEFNITALGSDVTNLKWYQLDGITISDLSNQIVKKFKFNFSNQTSQRLTLNSFSEQDVTGNNSKNYQFIYDNITGLPSYGGDQTDHWGYYNGSLLNAKSFASLPVERATNPLLVTRGLLQTVIYPTGGKTIYVWEANTASNVVTSGRQSLQSFTPLYVGGCRIKQINNYPDPAGTPLTTKYFYGKKFSVGVDPATLTSSGILNGTPQYYFNIPSRPGVYGDSKIGFKLESVNSLVSYSYNGSSSHVGYSEVVEQKPDNSYTKYSFTNFDADLNGNAHWDEQPVVIGWELGGTEDSYVTMSSKEIERGKPIMTSVYRNDNILLQKTNLYYRTDAARFNSFIKMYDLRNSASCNYYDAVILASAYKAFQYNYYVVKEVKTMYDMNGSNPVVTTNDYEYNLTNQLNKSTSTESNGRKLINKYKYPSDFSITTGTTSDVLGLQLMKTKNMVATPVEVQVIQEVNSVQTLLNGKIVKFKDMGAGVIKPSEELETELLSPSTDLTQCSVNGSNLFVFHPAYKSKVLYDTYGVNGNINGFHKANDISNSYLWGYNGSYPVAEVINAKSNEIFTESFEEAGTWPSITALDKNKSKTGQLSARIDNPGPGELYTHSAKSLAIGLTEPTKYKYSGWFYSNGPSAELILFMKRANETAYYTYMDGFITTEINKWVFVEKEFLVPQDVVLLNLRIDNNSAGSVWYDEIRLYPSAAQMTTYTYAPLVGLTSKSDINNRTTYYSYDEWGRLQLVKDQDGKILKEYCYNYTGQVENCVTKEDILPKWEATGNFRCKPCPTNAAYNTNVYQNMERDMNPLSSSSTYFRWVDKGFCSLDGPASWENTTTATRCQLNSANQNTGGQEQEQKDMNPCSTTYNQIKWIVTGTNTTACPVPQPQCNSGNCTGVSNKCISDICETGSKVITSSTKEMVYPNGSKSGGYWRWTCVYHYQWSDNSISPDYTQTSRSACQ